MGSCISCLLSPLLAFTRPLTVVFLILFCLRCCCCYHGHYCRVRVLGVVLSPDKKVFFCKYNDPIYVKMEKLETIIRLVNDRNIDQVRCDLM